MLTYVRTLNLIRLAIKHKLKYIKISKSKRALRLLNVLVKCGIIYGWSINTIHKKNYYFVYCNLKTKNIHTLIKSSLKIPLKTKFIKPLFLKYSSATIFLTTSEGILSIREAHKKNIGGFLLFRII